MDDPPPIVPKWEAVAAWSRGERWSHRGLSVHVSVANGIVYVGGSGVRGLSLETGKMVRSFSGLRPAETVSVGSGLLFAATETELSVLDGARRFVIRQRTGPTVLG
jgi:hypothetical protein